MTPIERAQIDAARRLLDEVLRLDATAAGEPGEMPAPILAACVILDPLLEATHQGTCYAAALAGDPGALLCAVTRAQSQIAQIDTSGTRPSEAHCTLTLDAGPLLREVERVRQVVAIVGDLAALDEPSVPGPARELWLRARALARAR